MFKRYVFIEGLIPVKWSQGKYLINTKGQIKDIDGNDLPYSLDKDSHKTVECTSWDGHRSYRVIDLVAIHYKFLFIQPKDFNKVEAFCIDGNKENTNADNVGYRFSGGRLEVPGKPGYFYVPGYTRVAINESGDCFDVVTGKAKNFYITKPSVVKKTTGGYHITPTQIKETTRVIGRHRALCLVFKDYPDNVDSLVVNHKNGIPGDDRLENLEFVTRKQNNIHAYENNLRTQNKKVLVRNVRKNIVIEYNSLAEAARSLGFSSEETIRRRVVESPYGKIFSDGLQVKLKDDPRPWKDFEDIEEEISKSALQREVLARNCETLEVSYFDSMVKVAKYLGVSDGAVRQRLETKSQRPVSGHQVKEASNEEAWENFTESEFRASLATYSLIVEARNLLTGEKRIFGSMRKAASFFNKPHISALLSNGRQPLTEDGWQLKLENWFWDDVQDVEKALYSLRRDIMARNVETGETLIANNAQHLASILKACPKEIRKAAFTRGNKVYKGFQFRLGITKEEWPSIKT